MPAGFRARMRRAGIAGMDVLWFERERNASAAGEWRGNGRGDDHDARPADRRRLVARRGYRRARSNAASSTTGANGASDETEGRQRCGGLRRAKAARRAPAPSEPSRASMPRSVHRQHAVRSSRSCRWRTRWRGTISPTCPARSTNIPTGAAAMRRKMLKLLEPSAGKAAARPLARPGGDECAARDHAAAVP